MAMKLTAEQQAMLDGEQGEAMAKVMQTLVMYGETFGASEMVPVTARQGHLVTSFGLSMMKPVYALMDKLIEGGAVSRQSFTVDPKPLDKNVPANLLQSIFFKIMYSKQDDYDAQLAKMGIAGDDAYTCTNYMQQVGNVPQQGEVLSWAESSAVVYANSVLGARCNRNSGIIELFGSIAGCVPSFGLLTDEGRKATWVVDVRCEKMPEAQVLGSAIGMKVMEDVPYIKGMENWLGHELTDTVRDYLKDFGAATASNGAVGLYHIAGLTPEAKEQGDGLLAERVKTYVIDDAELERVKNSYPVMWKDKDAAPKLCFVGCPHLSIGQLKSWTEKLSLGLLGTRVKVPTVFTAAPAVLKEWQAMPEAKTLADLGVIVSYICPLMYMNNPMCAKMPVMTNSNKLRTYTTARYYTDAEILAQLTGEVAR